ncbi:MAG: cupin domain-containing protein [Verrucomicrobiota bacterium]
MKRPSCGIAFLMAVWCFLGVALHAQNAAPAAPGMVAAPVSVPYSPPALTNVLGTTFVNWDSMPVQTTSFGETRAVFNNPTPTLGKLEVHVTTLAPGMVSHAVQHQPWEEILVIKEGEVEVSINGQARHAGPGCMIFFASHDAHNVRNAGEKPAVYYAINFYTDLVQTVPDKPAAEQAAPGKLPSKVIDCNSLPVTVTRTGSTINILDSATLTFQSLGSHITTLNAGQSTRSEMVDSGDEVFILKSGLLEATVNGVTSRIKEGSVFYCAPNDKRTFRNIGATPAAYQVIKVVSDKTPK